jgi:DNA polymerase III alpha subunit
VRERRAAFDRDRVAEIVTAGTEKARVVARATLRDVRRAMSLTD